MVVLYHSRFYAAASSVSFVRNSYLFVDFFFLLSGFVMAHSYLDRIGNGIGLRKFIVLRFGRLYPLHLFTLLLWAPYIVVKVLLHQRGIGDTDPSESNNLLTFLSNLFLFQAFDGYYPLTWNFPSWSISAEFYTYLIFFLFIYFISKILSTPRVRAVYILCISILSYTVACLADGHGMELFLFQCMGGFFLGAFLFFVHQKIRIPRVGAGVKTVLELSAIAFMVLSVSMIREPGFRDNPPVYLSIFSFFCLIFCFVSQEEGFVSNLLKGNVFQFIGKRSYSIYMMHAIVLASVENVFVYLLRFDKSSFEGAANVIVFSGANLVNLALLLAVIMLSAFTYEFVELPWRMRFRKLASRV